MVSVKFKCPHCDKVNDFHLFYNLNFRLCEYKGMSEVAQDGFIANCEHCGGAVDFEVELKQCDYNEQGDNGNAK